MSAATHVPPQNIEAEESVLGAMLVAESALTKVLDGVKLEAANFYLDRHRIIFEVSRTLFRSAKPVDELTVMDELARRELLDQAGGKHYVSELAAKVPAAGNAKHYAEIVRGHSLERQKQAIGLELQNGLAPADAIEQLKAIHSVSTPTDNSWKPVDLNEALEGISGPEPTILTRDDGVALIYDEKLHQVSAEPESGKGWFACQATAELIVKGCNVAYFDFESDEKELVDRLRCLGLSKEQILDHFIYARPNEPAQAGELEAVLKRDPALVIFDGVTEVLTIHGLSLDDNADVAKWLELLPRPAMRAGAAVLMIDHVKKDKDSRGRYAIGAQHKLAGVDVSYGLEVVEPFGRGREGIVKVKVWKDKPGHVRTHETGDGEIAVMRLSSDEEAVTVALEPPDSSTAADWMPTEIMAKISAELERSPGMTKTELRGMGKSQYVDKALRHLIPEYVEVRSEGQSKRHYPLKPFVEVNW